MPDKGVQAVQAALYHCCNVTASLPHCCNVAAGYRGMQEGVSYIVSKVELDRPTGKHRVPDKGVQAVQAALYHCCHVAAIPRQAPPCLR